MHDQLAEYLSDPFLATLYADLRAIGPLRAILVDITPVFAKGLKNYEGDSRAIWYYTTTPQNAHEIERVVDQIVGNGNYVTFNFYGDITGLGGRYDHRHSFEEVRREIDRMIARYPDQILFSSHISKVVSTGRLFDETWGYDVCCSITPDNPINQERVKNGNPFNAHFNAYNPDLVTTRRCCVGNERDCTNCYDVYAHFSWIMMNLHRHLGTKQDFTDWLTTMYVFYLGNRILPFEDRIGVLRDRRQRRGRPGPARGDPLGGAGAARGPRDRAADPRDRGGGWLGRAVMKPDQRLDHLGVDSLMGLELRVRLETELGISIPMEALLAGPMITQLAQLLVAQIGGTPASRPAEPPRANPEVILIRPGSRAPLFCIHPGALDTDCYTALADRLDDAQPFYSIRLAELESSYWGDGGPGLSSLGDLAASCIAAIRDIQPEGPYFLGGWSLGGVIALEITCQLERDHQRVALLAVFDSPTPIDAQVPDEADARLVTAFASYLGARQGKVFPAPSVPWDGLELDARLRQVLDWARRTAVVPPATDLAQLRALMDTYARGLRASIRYLTGYQPERCAAPIAYFRATDVLGSYDDVFPDTSAGWHQFTSQPLTIVETPGDHYTMFLSPNAATLAAKLGPFLHTSGGQP